MLPFASSAKPKMRTLWFSSKLRTLFQVDDLTDEVFAFSSDDLDISNISGCTVIHENDLVVPASYTLSFRAGTDDLKILDQTAVMTISCQMSDDLSV